MGNFTCAHKLRAVVLGSVASTAIFAAVPAGAAVTPDGVTAASVVDTANTQPWWVGLAIRSEAGNSGATCTGLLINPRTVIFAAHCVDGAAPGAYDAPTSPGNRAQVGYTTDPTFGRTNLREWLFGMDFVVSAGDARVMDASSVMVWYDPRSRFGSAAIPGNGTFLPADIALAAFDTPNELLGRDAANGIALLFSALTAPVSVQLGGYGQSGNGFDGTRTASTAEESYYRRLVNNTLGYLGDERSIALGVYPGATADILETPGQVYQDLYWADFDDPQRATRPFFNGPGADPVCPGTNPNCRLDHDVFPGSAVAGEGITAAGDSGSPLATNAFGRTVSLGVLSQGSRFFYESIGNPNDNFVRFTGFSNFGTTAGYNPLFLFWDQIVVNNPYKYVAPTAGDGEWTDASRWVQELDPLYMILVGGNLVNALPGTPALGVSSATANFGAINANPSPPATCAFLGTCPPTGGTDEPMPGSTPLPGSESMAGTLNVNDGEEDLSPLSPPVDALVAGVTTTNETAEGESITPENPPNEALTTALWSSGTLVPVNTGTLTGPGTTNFVPDNTNGVAGLQNSARFFEVNLRAPGTTFLTGTTVTIDRLNVRGANSGLIIRAGAQLNTTISSYVDDGTLTVNGVFDTTNLFVLGGRVMGAGTINANLFNVAGVVAPGNSIATMNVIGPYVQGPAALLEIELTNGSSDVLAVTGNSFLGGTVSFHAFGPNPIEGQTYDFVTTTGVRNGIFSTVQDFIPGTLFPIVSYGSNYARVTVGDLCSFATGAVDRPICQTLSDPAVTGQPGMLAAIGGVQALASTPDQLTAALQALNPTRATAQSTVGLTIGDLLKNQFGRRSHDLLGSQDPIQTTRADLTRTQLASVIPSPEALAAAATAAIAATATGPANIELENGFGLYFAGDVAMFDIDQAGGIGTDVADASALTVGFDHSHGGSLIAGLALSHLQSTVNQDYGLGGYTSSDGLAVSAYASVDEGGYYADMYASAAWHSFDTERTLLLAPHVMGIAVGETDAKQFQVGMTVGYGLLDSGRMSVGAVGGLYFVSLDVDGYSETGAGLLGATIASRSIESLKSQLGGEFAFKLDASSNALVPMLRVVWNHEFMDDPLSATSAFIGAPAVTFNSPGPDLGSDWATIGLGIKSQVSADTNFYIRVQKDIGRDGEVKHEVSAAARFGF